MSGSMQGRVAVITGASSGIGAATARLLAAEGAAVALLARRAERLEALALELEEYGAKVVAIQADVTDPAAVAAAGEQVASELGRVDLLVNNAGVMLLSPFEADLVDEWERMIDVNFTAVLHTTRVFLPALRDGGGDVVNISSVAGRVVFERSAVYNGTKHAVGAWSEALRKELAGTGVRVGLIEPGVVATELTTHFSHDETKAVYAERYDGVERLEASDVADAVLFMVSRPPRAAINEILLRPSAQKP
ncbi:MAG: SDR family oxidoreductase [Solirubrobacteraceae bacterium]|nr:SDR family oxidoreductase [Solirubrobacteraceae bacterium]